MVLDSGVRESSQVYPRAFTKTNTKAARDRDRAISMTRGLSNDKRMEANTVKRALELLCVHWLLFCAPPSRGAPAADPKTSEVQMPARDGVELATTVYLPPEGQGPWPCVLARTPYNKDGNRGQGKDFAARGYAFVAQDVRGKFKSKGSYDPFRNDHLDGYDAVEWIATQPWSNGKVGMIGGSALGITSHLAATQAPPHLLCAYVVVAESSARFDTVYRGGVYRKELNDGWLTSQGAMFAIGESIKNPPSSSHWDWREMKTFHARSTGG
jgi:predicted acyl esterase